MSEPQIKVRIGANDDTKKGADAAVKTLGTIGNRANKAAAKTVSDLSRAGRSRTVGILKTVGAVEKATASAFGNKSVISGTIGRLGALSETLGVVGEGFGAAALEAGAFAGAVSATAATLGAVVAVGLAAGYAAYKIADGWSKGAAAIGRFSQVIGIAVQDLQAFQQAGERAGVTAQDSGSALNGLAQTFNDAKYGRNNPALYMMSKLGVQFRTGKDGQLDTVAMTQDLADALARQKNAQTRRMVAQQFGISDSALPMFLGGSKQLNADMVDAKKHGAVMNDNDIATAERFQRKSVTVGQMGKRVVQTVSAADARLVEPAMDKMITLGRSLMDSGKSFSGGVKDFENLMKGGLKLAADGIQKGAEIINDAGTKMRDAANSIADSFTEWNTETTAPLQYNAGLDPSLAPKALAFRQWYEKNGFSRNSAAGMTAQDYAESKFNPFARGDYDKKSGQYTAYGLKQWHKDRQDIYARLFGHTMQSVRDPDRARLEQLQFSAWETKHNEATAGRNIRAASTAFEAGATASREYERPADVNGQARARGSLATRIATLEEKQLRSNDGGTAASATAPATIPVKVDVNVHDRRTEAKVTAGGSRAPAISHAFDFSGPKM
ncbi:MAG TPA: phage tail tip lysozyme [Sphingobium sp.]|uniref:phage tail tip lysozyme n=1 Tax=Sphingobium sp. TaxID=1912891 RepID=UPI002ED6C0D8